MPPSTKTKSGSFRLWPAVTGLVTGFFALIGASCCVLPLLLLNLGVSTAMISNLEFFAVAKPYFLGVTSLLIVASLIMAFRNGGRPSGRALALMSVSALVLLAALVAPIFEPQLIALIR